MCIFADKHVNGKLHLQCPILQRLLKYHFLILRRQKESVFPTRPAIYVCISGISMKFHCFSLLFSPWKKNSITHHCGYLPVVHVGCSHLLTLISLFLMLCSHRHTHTRQGSNPCSFASPLCWPLLLRDRTRNYSLTTNSCQQGCQFNSLSSGLSCMPLLKHGREVSKDTLWVSANISN